MYAKQSSLELLRYWDLSGGDSDTFASSVNIRHHRHHYHITTATMANTTNTTEITIVKAIMPPDHRILSLHHASSSICAQSLHRTASPTTSIYFFFVASSCFYNNLIDIVLPQMSYLSPTSRLCRYPACCSLRTNSPPSTSPVVALAFLWCRIPTLTLELRRVMATRKV